MHEKGPVGRIVIPQLGGPAAPHTLVLSTHLFIFIVVEGRNFVMSFTERFFNMLNWVKRASCTFYVVNRVAAARG